MARVRIGDLLRDAGLITASQLEDALRIQQKTRERLGDILIQQGLVTEDRLLEVLERQLGISHVSLGRVSPQASVLALVPEGLIQRHMVLPIRKEGQSLTLAMADPLDYLAIEEVRIATGLQIRPVLATRQELEAFIQSYFGMRRSLDDALQSAVREAAPTAAVPESVDDDSPVVRVVHEILNKAVRARASDIHFDPDDRGLRVRYRVDGMLRSDETLPRSLQSVVTARIKVMANLNIAERRVPQDGRFRYTIDGRDINVRVATLPTVRDEKIVLRLFDTSRGILRLNNLQLREDNLSRVQSLLSTSAGMILVSGPTGSGKTSTLYAMLREKNTSDVNIITVEDPVEYQLEGINQVSVNAGVGLTFATGLRSILRQDPDIIMVGEVRDTETAQMATRAALTGHLVLSTIHTGGAVETIARLADMGVEPYLVAASVTGVIAQRLVRTVCSQCARPYEPSEVEWAWVRQALEPTEPGDASDTSFAEDAEVILADAHFVQGTGCQACGGTGYHGRIAIQEVVTVDDTVRHLILQQAPEQALWLQAEKNGSRRLTYDGVQKAAQGLTTIEELIRVASRQ